MEITDFNDALAQIRATNRKLDLIQRGGKPIQIKYIKSEHELDYFDREWRCTHPTTYRDTSIIYAANPDSVMVETSVEVCNNCEETVENDWDEII